MNKANPVVDKLEAIRRQIDTAIWLWFNEADLVSINTLADAAMIALDELYQALKMERPLPFNTKYMPEGMTTEELRERRKRIKEAGTFAKHARHDHDLLYEYNPVFTELYIHCAVMAHTTLEDYDMHGLRSIFCLYFGARWPQFFQFDAFPVPDERIDIERVKELSRTEFFQEFGGDFVGNPPRPDVF
jgi:hypothetical protein